MNETAYVGLGSNLGNSVAYLRSALDNLSELGEIMNVSSVYETVPWGVFERQPNYLNMVATLKTSLEPEKLVSEFQIIEQRLGRELSSKGTGDSRTIDIDLLLYGLRVVGSSRESLVLPHPLMHKRAFVLIPLSEIAPGAVHPLLKTTVSELTLLVDSSDVRLVSRRLSTLLNDEPQQRS